MPKERIMRRIWVQRMPSMGSSEMKAPSGSLSWWPWAEAWRLNKRRVEVRRIVEEEKDKRGENRGRRDNAIVAVVGRSGGGERSRDFSFAGLVFKDSGRHNCSTACEMLTRLTTERNQQQVERCCRPEFTFGAGRSQFRVSLNPIGGLAMLHNYQREKESNNGRTR